MTNVRVRIPSLRHLVAVCFSWFIAVSSAAVTDAVVTKSPPHLNQGRVKGSVRVMTGGNLNLNSGLTVDGSLIVPGAPEIRVNGGADLPPVVDGTGSLQPSNYRLALNGGVALGGIARRVDGEALPAAAAPAAGTGTRHFHFNQPGDSPGDFATIRTLTVNAPGCAVTLPPGRYERITVNGASTLTLHAGSAAAPARYEIQQLDLNGGSRIDVSGPVELQLKNSLNANGYLGDPAHPEWLTMGISSGSFTLNSQSAFHGTAVVPAGSLIVNGGSLLHGMAFTDRLILNGGGVIECEASGGTPNQPPVATGVEATTPVGAPVGVALQATDPEGQALTFTVTAPPLHGTVAISGTTATYTPDLGFVGTDLFHFMASDGSAESAPAGVVIHVFQPNRPPSAASRVFAINQGESNAPLMLSAADPDGDAVTYEILTQPQHGLLGGAAPALTYAHTGARSTVVIEDSFTYRAVDAEGAASGIATVTMQLQPVNRPPLAADLPVTTAEDTPVAFTLPASDDDGDALSYVVELPEGFPGTLSGEAPVLEFLPAAHFHGTAAFSYTATDPSGAMAAGEIHLTVTPVNDPPVVQPVAVTGDEDQPIAIQLAATDADGDPLAFTITRPPGHGVLIPAGSGFTYAPDADFHGEDSFAFTAGDGVLESGEAEVSILIAPVNDVPVVAPVALASAEDTPLHLTLPGSDPDGDLLTWNIVLPDGFPGAITGEAPALVFAPAADFHGTAEFSYTATDPDGASAAARVEIVVLPVNDPPRGADAVVSTLEDTPLAIVLAGADADSPELFFEILSAPAHGLLTGIGPSRTYAPPTNFHGNDSFSYRIFDGALHSPIYIVAITVVSDEVEENRPPRITSTPRPRVYSAADPLGLRFSENGDWEAPHVLIPGAPEAEMVIRWGDIDNFGYSWPAGFDPFSGASTPAHGYPFFPESSDPAGTDRIMVGSGGNPPRTGDGYRATTSRPGNLPQPVSLRFSPPEGPLTAAKLQIFADDFQSQLWGSRFEVTVDGERFPELESLINQLLQTGPIGRLVSVEVPPQLLPHFADGSVDLLFDDPTTGAGDGYAIDFVKLLLNPNQRTRHFDYTLAAEDPDGDPLSYLIVRAPSGYRWDAQLRILRWTPPAGFSGSETVELEVRDNRGGVTRQAFELQVSPQDNPPVVSVYADRSPLRTGATSRITVAAADDFDVTGLSLTVNGRSLELDGENGAEVLFDEVGEVEAVAIVTDSSGQSRSATLRVLVATPATAIEELAEEGTPPPHLGPVNGTPPTTPPVATPFQLPQPGAVVSGTLVMDSLIHNPSGGALGWSLFLVPAGEVAAASPLDPAPAARHRVATGTLAANALSLRVTADSRPLADGAYWLILETVSPTSGLGRRGMQIEVKNSADAIGAPGSVVTTGRPPSLTFAQPASGATITAVPVEVVATIAAGDAPLGGWSLALAPADEAAVEAVPTGAAPFVEIASGAAPVTHGVLATLDPATLTQGPWLLRLAATDTAGNGVYSVRSFTWSQAAESALGLDAGADRSATAFQSVSLAAAVSGTLPAGSLVRWSAVAHPAGSVPGIQQPGSLATTVSVGEAGRYTFDVRVTLPSGETASDRVNIEVSAGTVPPDVRLAWPLPGSTFAVGGTLRFAGSTDLPASAIQSAGFFLDGASAGTATRDAALNAWMLSVPIPAGGTHQARFAVTLVSGETLVSPDTPFTCINPALPSPDVEITSPEPGDSIAGPAAVLGRVDLAGTGGWSLSVAPVDGGTPRVIASGTSSAAQGTLGTLDPSLLPNGAYRLTLVASNASGTSRSSSVEVAIEGNLKIGHFTLAFDDLTLPAPGVPLTVTRTYDSRDARDGDFGPAWNVGLRSVRVRKVGRLGEGWEQTLTRRGFFPTFAVESTSRKRVILSFPDGRTESFEPVFRANTPASEATPNVQQVADITAGTLEFRPLAGSQGTLETEGVADIIWNGPIPGRGSVIDITFNPANPTRFRYTEPEGTSYVIDETLGLVSIAEPNGNTLQINSGGIFHSNGDQVLFTRDAAGRITEVTDPAGEKILYGYDGNGRLATVTDRVGEVTTFFYENPNFSHYLTSILDPRGIPAIRSEYDADGRLVAQTDAAGRTVEFEHALADNREIVRDRLGNVTVHEYDDRGNVTRTIDALGGVTSYTYDANDNETSITSPLGFTTTRAYDGNDNLLAETDPLGHVTRYTYDSGRRPLTIADALGQTTRLAYSLHGNLLSMQDPAGTATGFGYDGHGNVATVTDAIGTSTSSTHDSKGNELITTVTDAADNVLRAESHTYDTNGNRLTSTLITDHSALITSYAYDAANRLTRTTYPDGTTSETIYNAIGKPWKTLDAAGRETVMTYDARGHLVRTDFPDGTFTTAGYDVEGRQTATTDAAGLTTYTLYDALGRSVVTILPDEMMPATVLAEVADIAAAPELADNPRSATSYDADGRVTATTDEHGHSTTFEYDAAGRRTATINAVGHRYTTIYDAAGRQVGTTDAKGNTTTYAYDAAGRLTRTTFPDGTFATTGYDTLGRRTSATDQNGDVTTFKYDAQGRLTAVVDAEGGRTSYDYDTRGLQTVQRDALGRATTYAYDAMGRRTGRTLPSGQAESYAYDLLGRLTGHTDFNGHTTTREYDPLNDRLLAVVADPGHPSLALTHAPARHEFGYDVLGRRTAAAVKNAAGTVLQSDTWSYDLHSRPAVQASTTGTLRYAWDATGTLAGVKSDTPGGYDLSYDYDALDRLTTVHHGQEGVDPASYPLAAYGYDANGNLAGVSYANQVTHAYAYNALNRLTGLAVDRQPGGSGGQAIALQGYAYALNAAGHRTGIAELGGRTIAHTYDRLYRLTSETISSLITDHRSLGTVSYTYDPVGNRLTRTSSGGLAASLPNQSHQHDANDRLTHHGYDANGNTTGSADLQSATSLSDTYSFDNRLIRREHGDGLSIDLLYNTDGDRVAKWVKQGSLNLRIHRYLVDRTNPTGYAQVVEESDGTGALVARHHYGHDLIASDIRNQKSAIINRQWYGYDGLGSVRGLSDDDGFLQETYDYDAYGTLIGFGKRSASGEIALQDLPSALSHPASEYLFTGEQWDADLGMYFLRARYLNPDTGRFHTMDTYEGRNGEPLSLHKYLYAHANPVSHVDPSGQAVSSQEQALATSLTAKIGSLSAGVMGAFRISVSAGYHALRTLGIQVELGVARILANRAAVTVLGSGGAAITRISGPGGNRIIDFLIRIRDRLYFIEVKASIPTRAGDALFRLVGQIQSATAQPNLAGTVVFYFRGAPADLQRVINLVGQTGHPVTYINGFRELINWLNLVGA